MTATAGKRNNWLLIKHRDGYERKNSASVLDDDRSVASARGMDDIAAGKGRAPKSFMARGGKAAPDAVWHSNRDAKVTTAADLRRKRPLPPVARRRARMPSFVPPQLCKSVSRPPKGDNWVHEIKLDGYRMQLRVEGGEAALRTRKGLDWTDKFTAIAESGSVLPDCIIDGEICALDKNGSPDFAALQAAISEGRSRDLVFFVFDLLFDGDEDLRGLPLSDRKERLKGMLRRKRGATLLRYVDHLAEPGDAVLRSACRLNLEGIISKRIDVPYQSGRTETWMKSKCRAGHEVVIGGWRGGASNLRSLLVGVYRTVTLSTRAASAPASIRAMPPVFSNGSRRLPPIKARLEARTPRAAPPT